MGGQPNASYIITSDGRKVTLDEGVPSLVDIATSLARMPRFAGNTPSRWTVLDHSLFIERMAGPYARTAGLRPELHRVIRLAALLHDAHEAVTGDIPTSFKTADMRALQQKLDRRIMQEYFPGGVLTYDAWESDIRILDRRALLAEAVLMGPFAYASDARMVEHFGEAPNADDVELLKGGWDGRFGFGPFFGPDLTERELVDKFLRKYVELR